MGSSTKWQSCRRNCGQLQVVAEALGEGKARGMSGGWQGLVRRQVKSRRWLTGATVGSEGGESENGAGEEKMDSKCSNSALEGSRWPGVQEGTGSKCGEAVE